jgi:FMN phosphatase YigB (HAD superfamily)
MIKAIIFDFYGLFYFGGGKPADQSMFELARSLKKNYSTGVLSSLRQESLEEEIKNLKGSDAFDVVRGVSDDGPIKPEPGAFSAVAQALGAELSEIVFVDDMMRNVESAKDLGIKAVFFENKQKLLEDFKDLGIVVE